MADPPPPPHGPPRCPPDMLARVLREMPQGERLAWAMRCKDVWRVASDPALWTDVHVYDLSAAAASVQKEVKSRPGRLEVSRVVSMEDRWRSTSAGSRLSVW